MISNNEAWLKVRAIQMALGGAFNPRSVAFELFTD